MVKAKPQGNPNPSPDTRFGGPRSNPHGKTALQKQAEMKAAEAAARIQERMLSALEGMFNEHPEKEAVVDYIKADVLRLLKDAMDRGFGMPVQKIDNTSSDGSMSPPTRVELVAVPIPDDNSKD